MTTFEQIITTLPRLNAEQLKELRQRITVLLSISIDGADSDTDLVLGCVCEVLEGLGLGVNHIAVLKRSAQYIAFKAKVPGLMSFIRNNSDSRIASRALLILSFNLLHQDLTRMGLTISSRTLLAHVHRIPATLDRHFPGYASSGMLRTIITKGLSHVRT